MGHDIIKVKEIIKFLEKKNFNLKKVTFEERLNLAGAKKSTFRQGKMENWIKIFDDEISERFDCALPGSMKELLE